MCSLLYVVVLVRMLCASRLLPPPLPLSYLWLRLHVAQHCIEAVKTRLPERAVALQPLVRFLEPSGFDAAGTPLRVAAARDQARMLEYLQMLGDRRLTHCKRLRQFHHRRLSGRKPRDDRPPGGICKRGERGIETG